MNTDNQKYKVNNDFEQRNNMDRFMITGNCLSSRILVAVDSSNYTMKVFEYAI
ncbi:MAG: hypothetical protein ACJ71K_07655 [Nitrososphaeraceae archaeon]